MVVMCHKPAQIINTARMSCDTVYLTIYNGATDLFKNFNEIYKCEHNFNKIISELISDSRVGFLDLKALSLKDKLESEDKNKLIAYMKPLMINATDRNTINHDDYQFYFNKLLTLKDIKIQNDVLTQEKIKANGFRLISTILGIISPGFMIYNYIYPDMTVRNAGLVAMGASSMLSRASALVNYG